MTSLELECRKLPQGDVTRHHPSYTNKTHGKPTAATTPLDATTPAKSPTMTVPSKMKKIPEPQVTPMTKAKLHDTLHKKSKPRPFNLRTVHARAKTRTWRN